MNKLRKEFKKYFFIYKSIKNQYIMFILESS